MKKSRLLKHILVIVLLCAISGNLIATDRKNETQIRDEFKLIASDGDTQDHFGYSVSVSGNFALIGTYADDDNGFDSGSAYIYHYNGTFWEEQQKLIASDGDVEDRFGNSVSISEDYVLIGAKGDDDNGVNSGSVYIYHNTGTSWEEQQKLTASDGADYDFFGNSVSISGDYALVGAEGDADSGSAYIYYYNGSFWEEQQKLIASDGIDFNRFGNSVSISEDYVLIGAKGDNYNGSGLATGSSYIYHFNGASWEEQQKLTASDGTYGDWFGCSVFISGDYAFIGAEGDDDNGSYSGSVYIFHNNETSWEEQQKLIASDGTYDDWFGSSVSISGDYAIIGAHWDDDNGPASGSAYIYYNEETSWVEQQKLTAFDGGASSNFGYSVSISEDYILIGAPGDDDNGLNSGSVYIFDTEDLSSNSEINISSSNFLINFPNPFNPETTISFELQKNINNPTIEIFNIKGEKIRTFNCQNQIPIIWDGTDYHKKLVSSGIYLYRLKADNFVSKIKKMTLLK